LQFAHILRIESGGYEITKDKDGYNGKKIPLERSNKICQLCRGTFNCVEDETHFLIDCPLYDNERSFFEEINRLNINFCNLDVKGKSLWLMTNEDHLILNKLREYLLKNFNKRTKELTSVNTKTKT
jgi:hypothetical protein